MTVVALPGVKAPPPVEPNEALIRNLEELLAYARKGELQSFIGCGFDGAGQRRFATWADFHNDVYQMLGSLAWLQHEYVDRHAGQ